MTTLSLKMLEALFVFILYPASLVSINLDPQYYVVEREMSWEDAESYCYIECNSNLASIHTDAQFSTLKERVNQSIQTHNLWIGLYEDPTNNYSWTWSDESEFEFGSIEGTYPWKYGAPDLFTNQSCVHISSNNAAWNDTECTDEKYFVCNSCYSKYHYFVENPFKWNLSNSFCQTRCGSTLANIDGYSNDYYNKQYAHSIHQHKTNMTNIESSTSDAWLHYWLGLKVYNHSYLQWTNESNTFGIDHGMF